MAVKEQETDRFLQEFHDDIHRKKSGKSKNFPRVCRRDWKNLCDASSCTSG
ncbi:MAG: hypothetical protein ACLVFI_11380 [Christensenellales bacterium]